MRRRTARRYGLMVARPSRERASQTLAATEAKDRASSSGLVNIGQ